jgi:hypothetical protein
LTPASSEPSISNILPDALAYLLLAFTLGGEPAEAHSIIPLFASPSGSDENNNCTVSSAPCQTIQHALDSCPDGRRCSLSPARGVYTTATGNTFHYHRVMSIVGNCKDWSAVVINIDGNSLSAFYVQDKAILTARCVTFATTGAHNVVMTARQSAIVDLDDVAIASPFAGGVLLNSENSSANAGGTIMMMVPAAFGTLVFAQKAGVANFYATFAAMVPGSIKTMFSAASKAVIDASGGAFSGADNTGTQCSISDATLYRPPNGIPGTPNTCLPSDGGVIK